MVSIICLLVLFTFVQSTAPTYIESSRTAYEINGMQGGVDSKKFNRVVTNYTNKHHVSAIKVFNVQTVNDTGNTQTKMYVYGKARVPKESLASKQEMQTSDIPFTLSGMLVKVRFNECLNVMVSSTPKSTRVGIGIFLIF